MTGLNYQCGMTAKDGRACLIPVANSGDLCHMHNPDGAYARQHPAYRARLLARLARQTEAPAVPVARRPRRCDICGDPIPAGDPVRAVSMPSGPPVVGHPVPCMSTLVQVREAPMRRA